jgi:hypothetical protein
MARNCIICGGRTGSGEHIFPAALGGRRRNKGIYCGEHNNGFSPLATILSDQLGAINALLSVRPDHSDTPRRFVIDGSDGENFALSGNEIWLRQPRIIEETETNSSREVTMKFGSEQQLQQWLAEQRQAGMDIRITSREEGRYFTEVAPIRLTLGGPDGLRAIGYVALTFLAHNFPDQARQAGVSEFKNFVQGTTEEQFVWWDTPDAGRGLPENPYRFGHTIAIGVSAERGEAYARVSLFSTLNFAAYIGAVDAESNRTVITHIDPHAERAPDDMTVLSQDALTIEVNRPSSLTTNLGAMIVSGRAQENLQLLFNRISEWLLECAMRPVLEELSSIRNLGESDRSAKIKAIVDKQDQRVLKLMQYVVGGLRSRFSSSPQFISLSSALDALVATDPNSVTGLSQTTNDALGITKARLAEEIERLLSNNDLAVC